jgi:aminoglycoside 3-N-acetyltransferase
MTNQRHTIDNLAEGLKTLDLKQGDMVLVRAGLKAMGELEQKRSSALLQALLNVVGTEGTVIGLAFNEVFTFPEKHKHYVVTADTPPVSGGLAIEMVKWPGALRSQHPTNSFVAIGRLAQEVIKGHDENSACFQPIEKILDHDGKMILVGCVSSSPGFSTVHFARTKLGLLTRSILSGRQGVYFERNNKVQLFKRKDIPGCSSGFYKLYSHYIMEGKLRAGWVGDAYSIAINARDAFEIDYRIIKKEPKYVLCDNNDCFYCRGSLFYNISDMPWFYISQLPLILRKLRKTLAL